jgi:hypothetical protein
MKNEEKAWIVCGIIAVCWAISVSLAGTAVAFAKDWDSMSYFLAWMIASFTAFFGAVSAFALFAYWLD